MSDFFYKQQVDAFYLNYEETLNEKVILTKKNYDIIDLFPKTKEVFEALEIEPYLFYLKNKSVASKFYLNHEMAFLTLKTKITGNGIDNHKKVLSLQLKGNYFLNHSFEELKAFYLKTAPTSLSKIEICFDFEASRDLLNETAKLFLDKKNYTNFEGSKTFINCENDEITGVSYLNSSKVIKIYAKNKQLDTNSKKALYFEKNPEFINSENFYRIEIGFITSKRIKTLFNINQIIDKINEDTFIKLIKDQFFKEFKVIKKSELKTILSKIQK